MAFGDYLKIDSVNATNMNVNVLSNNSESVTYDKYFKDYSEEYFNIKLASYISGLSSIDISFELPAGIIMGSLFYLYYSTDLVSWTKVNASYISSLNIYTINFSVDYSTYTQLSALNKRIYLKGNLRPFDDGIGRFATIKCSVNNKSNNQQQYTISGNIMSLCYEDEFIIHNSCEYSYLFKRLFYNVVGNTGIYFDNLVLPSILSPYCFCEMFYRTKILSFPKLPAIHLQEGCYQRMFAQDTEKSFNDSVSGTIYLPAKYIPKNAYTEMFKNLHVKRNIEFDFSTYENEDAIKIFDLDYINSIMTPADVESHNEGIVIYMTNCANCHGFENYLVKKYKCNIVTGINEYSKININGTYDNYVTATPNVQDIHITQNNLLVNGLKGPNDKIDIVLKTKNSDANLNTTYLHSINSSDFINDVEFNLPVASADLDILVYNTIGTTNLITKESINITNIHNTDDFPKPLIVAYYKPEKIYPEINILCSYDKYTDNLQNVSIEYNISNYAFINDEEFGIDTNNKWRNYIDIELKKNGSIITRALNSIIKPSNYEISETTFKNLNIDPSKTIYVKARINYSNNGEATYYSDFATFSTKQRNIYANDYFAITLKNSSGTQVACNSNRCKLYYSFDKYNWYILSTNSSSGAQLSNINDTIYLKGYGVENANESILSFSNTSSNVILSGNILSLKYGDNFTDIDEPDTDFRFAFYNCTSIVDAKHLVLPDKYLTESCFESMFMGCSNLTDPPELPATELASSCYKSMFQGCISLLYTPLLPAINIGENITNCYHTMFNIVNHNVKFKPIYAKNLTSGTSGIINNNGFYVDETSSNTTNNTYPIIYNKFRNSNFSQWSSNVEYSAIPFEDQYLTMTLTSAGYGQFRIPANINNTNNPDNIDYIAYSIDDGKTWEYTYIQLNNEEISINTPILSAGSKILWKGKAKSYSNFKTLDNIYDDLHIWISAQDTHSQSLEITYIDENEQSYTYTTNNITEIYCKSDEDIHKSRTVKDYPDYIRSRQRLFDSCLLTSKTYHSLSGNIMSLLYGDDFYKQFIIEKDYAFAFLFCGNTRLRDTEKLCLPATILTKGCYFGMFMRCSQLTNIPMIVPTKLYAFSYASMFEYAIRLINIQRFEILDLCKTKDKGEAYYACSRMFLGIGQSSDNLTDDIKRLSTNNILLTAPILTDNCYYMMFAGSHTLIQPVNLPALTLAMGCYSRMFAWDNFDTIPNNYILPAKQLACNCYSEMFAYSSYLSYVPDNLLPALSLADECYLDMFAECPKLKRAPSLPAKVTTINSYTRMFGGKFGGTSSATIDSNINYLEILAEEYSNTNKNISFSCASILRNNVATSGTLICRYDINPNIVNIIPASNIGNWNIYHNKYYNNPLTIRNLSSETNTITIKKSTSITTGILSYNILFSNGSLISRNTITYNASDSEKTISLSAKRQVELFMYYSKPDESNYEDILGFSQTNYNNTIHIIGTKDFEAYGNIESINISTSTTNWQQNTRQLKSYNFAYLFADINNTDLASSNLVKADNLYLPTVANATGIYNYMFAKSKIEKTPIMPATSLATSCYSAMYIDCKNLKVSEPLVATILAASCYAEMYKGCESLIAAPELLATTISDNCYYSMFMNCNNLEYIKILANTTNINNLNFTCNVTKNGTYICNNNLTKINIIKSNKGCPEDFIIFKESEVPTSFSFDVKYVYPYNLNNNDTINKNISLYEGSVNAGTADYNYNIVNSVGINPLLSGKEYIIGTTYMYQGDIMYKTNNNKFIDTINPKILNDLFDDNNNSLRFSQYSYEIGSTSYYVFNNIKNNYDFRSTSDCIYTSEPIISNANMESWINKLTNVSPVLSKSSINSYSYEYNDELVDSNDIIYKRVEYIANPGGAYIDTGITITNSNYSVEAKYKYTANNADQCVFGGRGGGFNIRHYGFWTRVDTDNNGNNIRAIMGTYTNTTQATVLKKQNILTENSICIVNIHGNDIILTIDDNIISYTNTYSPKSNNYGNTTSIYLFKMHSSSSSDQSSMDSRYLNGQMYYFNVWNENSELIHRFVPVKSINTNETIYGMFDIITNTFYGSANSNVSFTGPND